MSISQQWFLSIITIACLASYPHAIAAGGSQVEFLEDAGLPAQLWVRANPNEIAVSIRLGEATPVTPEQIERALRSDFANHGIENLRFFWERGGSSGSAVAFHTRNRVFGPFGLADSRRQIEEAAQQFLFELERGLN